MDYSAAYQRCNAEFAAVLADADHDRPVPSCPGWTIRKLMTHVGRGDRWAATIVSTRATGPIDPTTVADGRAPEGLAAALDWLTAAPTLLLDAVAADPDAPVWTFIGPRPAAWWVRRRLHEVLVHTADALLAQGGPVTADPATAADGVGEWLDLVAASGAPALDRGTSLHLHATDTDGEWTVLPGGDGGVRWEPGHAKATAALRGPAAELLMVLLRRLPAERAESFGDSAVLAGFLERTPF